MPASFGTSPCSLPPRAEPTRHLAASAGLRSARYKTCWPATQSLRRSCKPPAAPRRVTKMSVTMADPIVLDAIARGNPVVFFDITIGGVPSGRIKMELFSDETPKTAENFRRMCTGEFTRGSQPAGYLKTPFHRVIKEFMIQGGDILKGDGTGCISIYGESFADENFNLRHSGPGLLSMANSGPDTNGSQFFITCGKCEWLDGKHVVFGKVLDAVSMMVVHKIEAVQAGSDNKPKLPVLISQCGEL